MITILIFLFFVWYIPGFISIILFIDYKHITSNDILMSLLIGIGGWYSAYKIYNIYEITKKRNFENNN